MALARVPCHSAAKPGASTLAILIPVTDSADERIEAYRSVRDRDLRGRAGGLFVAEGETVIRVLLTASRLPVESLLLAENRVDALAPLFAAHDMPVYVAPPAVMDAIVGFPIHRGMLAIGRRGPAMPAAELLADRPPVAVGLIGIANHDNVGGIFRNCAAFGVGAVLMDGASCDPLYRKALRVSVGGVLRVPFARVATADDVVAAFRHAGYEIVGLSPSGDLRLDELRPGRPVALLLGAEGPGLPPDVMATVRTARIDMSGGFDSLNVATTSGIALYELTRR